jgi:hypothetical protein
MTESNVPTWEPHSYPYRTIAHFVSLISMIAMDRCMYLPIVSRESNMYQAPHNLITFKFLPSLSRNHCCPWDDWNLGVGQARSWLCHQDCRERRKYDREGMGNISWRLYPFRTKLGKAIEVVLCLLFHAFTQDSIPMNVSWSCAGGSDSMSKAMRWKQLLSAVNRVRRDKLVSAGVHISGARCEFPWSQICKLKELNITYDNIKLSFRSLHIDRYCHLFNLERMVKQAERPFEFQCRYSLQ